MTKILAAVIKSPFDFNAVSLHLIEKPPSGRLFSVIP